MLAGKEYRKCWKFDIECEVNKMWRSTWYTACLGRFLVPHISQETDYPVEIL